MTLYEYPDYLCHHGVKGMKWGVRKQIKPIGQNRSVAKQHNAQLAANKYMAKRSYKLAKKSGNASRIARTKASYKSAKSASRKNLAGRAATHLAGFTDSGRGSYYRHRQEGDSKAKAALKALGRQNVTNLEMSVAIAVGATAARAVGKAIVKSMLSSSGSGGANRLGSGDMLYPKYKVRNA